MTECDAHVSGCFRKMKKIHEEGDSSSSEEGMIVEDMAVRVRVVPCHPWVEEGSQLTVH